jgi:cytochrome c
MSLELNKIAAAILTGGVVAMGSGFVADLLVNPHAPGEPVYKVASKDGGAGGGTGNGGDGSGDGGDGGGEQVASLATRLADASASEGEKGVRACAACHSFNEGGPNKVGPNLYDVMGAEIASVEDFNYSNALSGKEGKWTYEKMDAWLANPSGWASGTSMSYPGIKDPQKRADVIMYMREMGENPPPLPEPEQKTAAAEADGGAGGGQDGGAQDGGGGASGDMQQQAKADTGGDSADGGDGGGLAQQIAAADPAKGESAIAVCKACHSFNKGGPNKVGPKLYGSLGGDIAGVDGFSYSSALSDMEGEWTLAKMDAWLENPNDFAPGNRMTYNGVKDAGKRHAIIAYMNQQTDDPIELTGGGSGGGDKAGDAGGDAEQKKSGDAGSAGDGDSADGESGDGEQKAEAGGGDQKAEAGGDGQQQASGDDAQKAESGQDAASGGDDATETQQAKADTGGDASGGGDAASGIAAQVAGADAAAGKAAMAVCSACHSYEKGGPNKVGPNLWNVVGSDIASVDGFNYSDALKGKEGDWTLAKLDKYLEAPNQWAPGNRMGYPGVKDAQKRLNMLAYLKSLSE